jgi:hypothetical protein
VSGLGRPGGQGALGTPGRPGGRSGLGTPGTPGRPGTPARPGGLGGLVAPLALAALVLAPVLALGAGHAGAAAPDEFFILSSLDAARSRIVLKRPTEVTLAMRVNDNTAYRSEQGKPLKLTDLRAGDTVYITYRPDAAGEPTAVLVRQGPMTVQELQRRYLKPAIVR